MESLAREGLVYRETLTFRELLKPSGALRWVNLRGRIYCCDDVAITVNKYLDTALDDRNQIVVRGQWYQYHAWVRGRPRRDLLRYDNCHGFDSLHRHFYDASGTEIAVEGIPLDTLPRLDLVIRESIAVATGGSIEALHGTPAR